ncbi:MAG: hypothetical protein R3C05_11750 [Pirellulaceae bacterium]
MTKTVRWDQSCLEPSQGKRPFVALKETDREAVKEFFNQAAVSTTVDADRWHDRTLTGADVLRRNQCLACHRRQTTSGNATL